MAKPRVVVQIGHEAPREPGFETQTGAAGELELVRLIGNALVARLERDGRVEVKKIPGKFPPEIKNGSFALNAFLALHGDGASNPAAEGHTFGFPPASSTSKAFADLVAAQFKAFHRSQRRQDNVTTSLSQYYGWKQSRMPTNAPRIVVEHGFLSNPTERAWLFGHVQELADAEYRAITKLLQLEGRALTSVAGPNHDADWPWFAEWALWRTGRGQYAPFGKANQNVRPQSAPTQIPRHAFDILRELQHSDKEVVAAVAAVKAASPMLTAPRASQAVLERYVLNRDHAPHTDDDARKVVKHYVAVSTRAGLDPLIPVTMMVLETNNLKSKWAQTHKNLAGIGVTHDDVDPASVPKWATWQHAVVGHVGRVLAYVLPKGRENAEQKPLIEAALSKRSLPDSLRGVAPTLAGIAPWAGDPKYVEKLVKLANEIRKA